MDHLKIYDLYQCVKRLPAKFKEYIKSQSNIIVAGGYIRSVILNEPLSDIDVFAGNREISGLHANALRGEKKLISTDNAFTVFVHRIPVQFIHRWVFESPEQCIESFDFTICQAAFWWEPDSELDKELSKTLTFGTDEEKERYSSRGGTWNSICSKDFYPDLAAKRLIYTWPVRDEEPGGSILRVLKYYQRGYRIPLDSFAAVIARLMAGVNFREFFRHFGIDYYCEGDWRIEQSDEVKHLAKILAGLLFEIDPNGFIDHQVYLLKIEDIEESLNKEV